MTAREWAVVEFDAGRNPIWPLGPLTEGEARERFEYVTKKRSQRSDVVIRTRSAALLCRGKVVDAADVRRSRRAPLVGNKRLTHLDVDVRERIIGLELLATTLARASLRKDGTPRIGPSWRLARGIATEILTLVRGASAKGDPGAWWLVEWACHCSQVERERSSLHDSCPYHPEAAILHGPDFIDS